MVGFRKAVHGAELVNWQVYGETVVSFGRGDKGHVVINTGSAPADIEVATGLPEGEYTDVISREARAIVDRDRLLAVTVAPNAVIAVLGTREE